MSTRKLKLKSKLMYCPFCRKENAEVRFIGIKQFDYWRGRIAAKCMDCGAEAGISNYRGFPITDALEDTEYGKKAIKAWNTRAYLYKKSVTKKPDDEQKEETKNDTANE